MRSEIRYSRLDNDTRLAAETQRPSSFLCVLRASAVEWEHKMKLTTPLTDELVEKLHAGDRVEITGTIFVARDAAHKRLVDALDRGEPLPTDLRGQIVYYMGPSPTKPGKVIGSAGPTTSGRMDKYAPRLMEIGLKGMIGKGLRAQPVKDAMKKYKAVYFAATGGAAALIAQRIKKARVIAYEELGAEALQELEVEDFPAIVVNDIYGGDAYEDGKKQYARK
jgi:fumarate hydratase subunit beta